MLAEGGREEGGAYYPVVAAAHLAWIASLFFLISPDATIIWPLIAYYFMLQQLRELRAQHHAEAVMPDVPTRDVLGVPRGKDSLPPPAMGRAPLVLRSTTPAAPSPNSAADTNMAMLGSLTRRQRLQRSMVRNRT
jgi:hypothetical protein